MNWLRKIVFVLSWLVILPASAYAQSSIAGVVKDASGAVLPGVTVEAASPVLIEKTRTAITDGTGQYRIKTCSRVCTRSRSPSPASRRSSATAWKWPAAA